MRHLLPALLLTATASAQVPASVTGIPTVTDGDTLQIRTTKIRLYGVDAPESSQTCLRAGQTYGCGREAAFALADLVRNKNVTCLRRDTDRYGRMVAVCTVGGTEINRWLVEQGHALPYLEYGGSIYRDAEDRAKATRKGLHAGTFQAPWDYRRNPANPPTTGTPRPATTPAPVGGSGGSVSYRTCAAARAAGAAPVRAGQPGYGKHLDRDGDGIGCE
ncbi:MULTISPECIES: excalibur calcium-binding domain-containing protein [Deinococcus]|uniref:Endonuclease YncB(Thermonuclease family) n=2 Tax=Deinococcus TaxID=1298 RepID=A0A7W8GHX4_9DEIO|nr:excalibur calcium-binding domain-containing protein [Deinococcus budaensis]MBB5235952.1 endonuclease YncB(thermonuclease family) [Deinococcus budaensis]